MDQVRGKLDEFTRHLQDVQHNLYSTQKSTSHAAASVNEAAPTGPTAQAELPSQPGTQPSQKHQEDRDIATHKELLQHFEQLGASADNLMRAVIGESPRPVLNEKTNCALV